VVARRLSSASLVLVVFFLDAGRLPDRPVRVAVPPGRRLPTRACGLSPTGAEPDVLELVLPRVGAVLYAVSVTPDGGTATWTSNTGGHQSTFTVTNTGTCQDTYSFNPATTGPITGVTLDKTSYTLSPGAHITVTATYSVGAPGSGVLTLAADGNSSDQGYFNVTVQAAYQVTVTPKGTTTPTRPATTGGYSAVFTVQNTGQNSDTYAISCGSTGSVTCTRTSATSLPLGSGVPQVDTAWYNVGTQGSGTLTLTAASASSRDSGSYAIPVGPPPGAPVVDASPYNYAKQDYGLCAISCFAAVYAQSTVPYVSFDAPRNVSLTYNSDRVDPRPFVLVNASPDVNYGQPPTEYRIQVKVNGTVITFLNGDQTLRFTYPGPWAVRLGGQFDASGYATGAYPLDILVSAYYANGTLLTNDIATKLLVDNETNSAIAAGWMLGGMQRLYVQSDGSALITEGEGSTAYFAYANGAFVSPSGEFSTLVPSTLSGTSGWARIYTDSSKTVFDNTGKMVQLRDRFNNITTVRYDTSGRVWTITDPANLTTLLGYNANGNGLSFIQDAGNPSRMTIITVDASHHLTAITDPDNVSTHFAFDTNVLLQKVINRGGDTTSFGYDNLSHKLTSLTFAAAPVYGSGTVSPTLSQSSWQVVGIPTTSTSTTPAAAPSADTVRARVTDPRGYITVYQVDRFGAITRIDDPAGRTTTYLRDSNSNVVRDSAPSGHIVRRTWSGSNITQWRDSTTGRTINYTYEPTWNELIQISGDADSVWNYWSHGHMDSTISGTRALTSLRRLTSFTYDALGRLRTSTDPLGHVDSVYYDGTSWRNVDSTRSGGRRIAYTYDSYGRLGTTKTPRGDVTSVQYDPLNRRTSMVGPNADTTIFTYDSLFLRQVRDAIGQTYQFSHNGLGWLTSQTDPAGRQNQYQYDLNGNLRQQTNRRNQVVALGPYDALNRPTSVTADQKTTTFAYDGRDAFTAVSNAESVDTLKFDPLGRVVSQIDVRGGTRYELVATHTVRDVRDTLRLASPWADTIAYRYNASLALDTLRDIAGGVTTLVYDQHLLDSLLVLPTGLTITRQWPLTHLPAQVSYSDGTLNASIGAKYLYDSLGHVAYDYRVSSTNGIADSARKYASDALGRLTSFADLSSFSGTCSYGPLGWSCSSAAVQDRLVTYSYDKVGNRKVVAGDTIAPGDREVRFNGDSLIYDADGNLTNRIRGGTTFQQLYWGSLGELDSVWTSGVGTVSFGYDGGGRRVRKTFGSTTTRYLYDGHDLFAEVDPSTPTTPLAEYTYYPGIDQPHSVRRRMRSDSVFYYAQDFPGSILGLVNGSNVIVNRYRYEPFGADAQGFPQGSVPNSLKFAARQFDTETGFYYMRARYYDPQLGRFISEDPIGLAGGINPYTYVGDGPVNAVDPTGQDCEELWHWTTTSADPSFTPPPDYDMWEPGVCDAVMATGYSGGADDPGGGEINPWGARSASTKPASPSCPAVPPLPAGESVDANMKLAAAVGEAGNLTPNDLPLEPDDPLGESPITAITWFFNQVKPGGDWDYARINRQRYDAGGNFNYGATGVALGIPPQVLLRAAGVAQVFTGHWKAKYGIPALTGPGYGDDPKGQAEIHSGIQYAQNHCGAN